MPHKYCNCTVETTSKRNTEISTLMINGNVAYDQSKLEILYADMSYSLSLLHQLSNDSQAHVSDHPRGLQTV